jgi:hypothetical protein
MALLETTDKIAPRSVVRHRPIGGETGKQGDRSGANVGITPVAQRAHRPRPTPTDTDKSTEMSEWQRTEDTKGAGAPPLKQRAGTGFAKKSLPNLPQQKTHGTVGKQLRHAHPLLYLGLGMLAMLGLWTAVMGISGWATTTMDNIRYGYPRTYQVDAYVGHNETPGSPSHFIAINLHGHIEVVEMPGGDAAHARIYTGPQLFGSGNDLVPVTLSFVDVNGDHKPDMVINVQGTQIVYLNNKGTFRQQLPSERSQ